MTFRTILALDSDSCESVLLGTRHTAEMRNINVMSHLRLQDVCGSNVVARLRRENPRPDYRDEIGEVPMFYDVYGVGKK